MSPKDLTEFLVIMDKLKIEANSNLSREDKEFYKYCIDVMKNEVNRGKKQ